MLLYGILTATFVALLAWMVMNPSVRRQEVSERSVQRVLSFFTVIYLVTFVLGLLVAPFESVSLASVMLSLGLVLLLMILLFAVSWFASRPNISYARTEEVRANVAALFVVELLGVFFWFLLLTYFLRHLFYR